MKDAYIAAMDKLYSVCMWIAGISLVVLTTMIPFGVFMRYVMNSALSWPEPLAIMIMIVFTFFAGAVCYRANMHISVMLFINTTRGMRRLVLGWVAEILMILFNLFILYYGFLLVEVTWHDYIGEFPSMRVGITYLPLPLGGLITLLFIIERMWTGQFFPSADNPSSVD